MKAMIRHTGMGFLSFACAAAMAMSARADAPSVSQRIEQGVAQKLATCWPQHVAADAKPSHQFLFHLRFKKGALSDVVAEDPAVTQANTPAYRNAQERLEVVLQNCAPYPLPAEANGAEWMVPVEFTLQNLNW